METGNRPKFNTKRECDTCSATSAKTGTRCKRRTCATHPYCWQHTQSIQKLKVKDSQVAGKGLYAAKLSKENKKKKKMWRGKVVVFKKTEKVVKYGGKLYTKEQFNRKYPGDYTVPYALELKGKKYLDARSTKAGVGRYANDCKGTRLPCNARLSENGFIVATKNIYEGDEILVPYGRDYWK